MEIIVTNTVETGDTLPNSEKLIRTFDELPLHIRLNQPLKSLGFIDLTTYQTLGPHFAWRVVKTNVSTYILCPRLTKPIYPDR